MGTLAVSEPSAFQQLKVQTLLQTPPTLPPPLQLMLQEHPSKRNLSAYSSRNVVLPQINTGCDTESPGSWCQV